MKETFYFPHDNNAHNDPKLMSLFMSVGLAGVGLYWILIELLHQQEDGMITKDQFENYIKWYSMKESNEGTYFVEQMLKCVETSGLFCFTEDGKVYSKRVIQNKQFREDLSKKRSEAGKESARKRALRKEKSTNVEQKGTSVEQGKEKKGNKKESKHKYGEYKNILLFDREKEKLIMDYGETIFYKYIKILDEGIQMKGYKYKDHNLAIRKWINRDNVKKDEGKKSFEKNSDTNWNEGL